MLLLLLLLKLNSHEILHLHEVIGKHTELLILRVISTTLRIEHHLHVHAVWVHIVHSLAWELHLILHHHTWELVHILHAVHAHGGLHLVIHTIILSHLLTAIWCATPSPQLMISMSIGALITILALATYNQKQGRVRRISEKVIWKTCFEKSI